MSYPQQQVPAHLTIDPAERPFLVAWHHILDLSIYLEGELEYMRYLGQRHDQHGTLSLVRQLVVDTACIPNDRVAAVIEDWIKANLAAAPRHVFGPANPEQADGRINRPGLERYEPHPHQQEAIESLKSMPRRPLSF